ncbi:MAG: hypothetical protein RL172_1098 [Bacteroidota bacterium]|jgi:RNA polymerase sigma factor (sigma-70 family)
MDTAQLIQEAKGGSMAAQKCLYDAWAAKMMLVGLRYMKNEQDAEEAMLDGFYKFFNHLQGFTYHNDAALYGWLKKIMVNECLLRLRKKNVFTIVSEEAAAAVTLDENALAALSAKEILNLVVQLPVGYRTVFNLYVLEGMEHKQIAALLGITEGTSKSQLSKARVLLQKKLLNDAPGYARQQSK